MCSCYRSRCVFFLMRCSPPGRALLQPATAGLSELPSVPGPVGLAGGAAARLSRMTEPTATPGRTKPDVAGLVVGVLGGTGDQGRGLARRLSLAGHRVLIGSRAAERAETAAREVAEADSGVD